MQTPDYVNDPPQIPRADWPAAYENTSGQIIMTKEGAAYDVTAYAGNRSGVADLLDLDYECSPDWTPVQPTNESYHHGYLIAEIQSEMLTLHIDNMGPTARTYFGITHQHSTGLI